MTVKQSLALILFGESASGKSTLSATGPKPYLVLDVESGSRYVKAFKKKVYWNPLEGPYPEYVEGAYDAVIVNVLDWPTLIAAYEYLNNTRHPFKSVILDSLTEAQKRLVDAVSGVDQVTLQNWGVIGRNLEDIIRKFRDLTFHPTNPVEAVIFTCLAHVKDGQTRPYLRGSLELSLPAFVDVVAFLYVETGSNDIVHKTLIAPANNIIAKDRTGALTDAYGPVIENANITEWLEILEQEFGTSTTK